MWVDDTVRTGALGKVSCTALMHKVMVCACAWGGGGGSGGGDVPVRLGPTCSPFRLICQPPAHPAHP